MRKVDAVWEKRNLGVDCVEIYFEKKDTLQDVRTVIEQLKETYQVLFLPIEKSDFLIPLQEWGFKYIESNFVLCLKVDGQFKMPALYNKILKKVSHRKIEKKDSLEFLETLRYKFDFDKDKITIDPFFSKEKSSNRNYWRTKEFLEMGRDLLFYEVMYKEKAIGYFCFERKSDIIYDAYLSGLYPESRNMNLGSCVMGEQTKVGIQLGAKVIETGVSLNNFSCYKIYQSLGYDIKNSTNIFIKHREG